MNLWFFLNLNLFCRNGSNFSNRNFFLNIFALKHNFVKAQRFLKREHFLKPWTFFEYMSNFWNHEPLKFQTFFKKKRTCLEKFWTSTDKCEQFLKAQTFFQLVNIFFINLNNYINLWTLFKRKKHKKKKGGEEKTKNISW